MPCKTIKVLSVFGTRPEAIKMAPVILKFRSYYPQIISKVVITAQHREMLDQVMEHFSLAADYDLDIMAEGQTLKHTTIKVLQRLTPILKHERPDIVLVHGDTATTAASALAAYYEKVSCGHVEAGLRTGDKYAPFPEEINRRIAGLISDIHFAPTIKAKLNLLNEGVLESTIFVTGNTAIDALFMTVRGDYRFKNETLNALKFNCASDGMIPAKPSGKDRFIVVEVHRRENFGHGMENICKALADIAGMRNKDVKFLVSLHKNPNAREPILRNLRGIDNVILFEPLDYPDYVNLVSRAYLVVSDSGGIQEEAPSMGVPVVLCRDKTERPEAIEAGTVVLVGTNKHLIVDTINDLLDNKERYTRMATAKNPFGDGRASERIAKTLIYWFGSLAERPRDLETFE